MNYPQSFKDKCKSVYPDSQFLHGALDIGSEIVGRFLDDSSRVNITPQEIIESVNLKKLQDKAKSVIARQELYSEWLVLYQQQKEVIQE